MNKNWAIAGIVLSIAVLTLGSVLALSPSAEAAKPQPEPVVTELVALQMTSEAFGQATFDSVSPNGDEKFQVGLFCETCSSDFFVRTSANAVMTSGKVWAGTLSEGVFELRGILVTDVGVGSGSYVPSGFTLSGTCGENSNVTFESDSGWTGSFTANVACV